MRLSLWDAHIAFQIRYWFLRRAVHCKIMLEDGTIRDLVWLVRDEPKLLNIGLGVLYPDCILPQVWQCLHRHPWHAGGWGASRFFL